MVGEEWWRYSSLKKRWWEMVVEDCRRRARDEMVSAWSEVVVGCWMRYKVVVPGLEGRRMRGRLWSSWSRQDGVHRSGYGVACIQRSHCEICDVSAGF